MHFYEFNIGDYAKKTAHLTNEEDIAYRRALDMYYDTEKPLPITHGLASLSRRLRVNEIALKNVIDEFFPDGKNKHADEKIAEYHAYINRQKSNGSKGGRPKVSQNNPLVSQNNPVPSQPLTTKPLTTKPLTNNINKPTSTKSAISIQTFLDNCKQEGVERIPKDDPVFDFAENNKIPIEMIRVCWQQFVRMNRENGKRQKDWRKAFRNCVRGNWYKIWFIEADGTVKETSQYRALKNDLGESNAE